MTFVCFTIAAATNSDGGSALPLALRRERSHRYHE